MQSMKASGFNWSSLWIAIIVTLITAGLPSLVAWGRTQEQISTLKKDVIAADLNILKIIQIASDVEVLKIRIAVANERIAEIKQALNRIEASMRRYDHAYPLRKYDNDPS